MRIALARLVLLLAVTSAGSARAGSPKAPATPHNLVVFVTDGMRHDSVTAEDTPALAAVAAEGVRFANTHAMFPTLTMVNAAAISTGHAVADTGVFANGVFAGYPVVAAGGSQIPFLEDDGVLNELDEHFANRLLNGDTFLASAAAAGYETAAVGKVGPAFLTALPARVERTVVVVDDQTGTPFGEPLPADVIRALTDAHLPLVTPSRGDNGHSGDFQHPGTLVPNKVQQQYFSDVTTKVLLPRFAASGKPFLLVFWSRDPDGTQHNQGDSLGKLTPGINGPTSLAGRRNADTDLAQIRAALTSLGLAAGTDVIVTADHGFSTISKQSDTSYAATQRYPDVSPGLLPPGFVAIDLAKALGLTVFDAGKPTVALDATAGQHPNHALLGGAAGEKAVAVAANGGSDEIYLLGDSHTPEMARRVLDALLTEDYASGLFVDDDLGRFPGTLPLSAIGLKGDPRLPTPAIFVSFRSFGTGCKKPTSCGAIVADTGLQQGQGNHGSFGRQDTFNFTAAVGPDFRRGYADLAPVSNADLAQTIAHVLGLRLTHEGTSPGRVLHEILANHKGPAPRIKRFRLASPPAANGLRTVVRYQRAGGQSYFDEGGFPGRTIGLE